MNANPVLSGDLALQQNRVLRNTYWLLSLTMVPTVVGALLGIQMNFKGFGSIWMNLIIFIGMQLGFIYAIHKTKDSPIGLALLLAFTFCMGIMLSMLLQRILNLSNGGRLIAMAAGGTAMIFAAMAVLASTIKKDLGGMGKFLFIGVILCLLAGVGAAVFQIPALSIAISVIVIGIFSAYIVYDLNQIIMGGETNYITATLSLYINVFAIFQNLLSLLGIFGGED